YTTLFRSHEEFVVQVRPGREPRGPDIAVRVPLGHALAGAEAAREPREMAVPGADAVRVSHLDQVPVAAVLAPDPGDDSVRRGPHRRPVRRREIDAFVGPPHVKDGMIPRAEPARDPAELQRCPEKRAPPRSAALVHASWRRSGAGRKESAIALSSASYSDDSIVPVTRSRVMAQGIVSTVSTQPVSPSPRTRVRRRSGDRRTVTRRAMLSVFRRRRSNLSPGRRRRTGRLCAAARKAA